MVALPKIPAKGGDEPPFLFPIERGPRKHISFPVYPTWIFMRLYGKGYRPRQQPVVKWVKEWSMCFTIQLPLKHWGVITTDIIRNVINAKGILHCREVRLRKNLKWIGITITLDCVGLKPLGE